MTATRKIALWVWVWAFVALPLGAQWEENGFG
jgi:hypothetical protein